MAIKLLGVGGEATRLELDWFNQHLKAAVARNPR